MSLSQAQAYYDTTGASGTNLTYREELEADHRESDFWTALTEELEGCEFGVTLTDLRSIIPNASAVQVNLLRNAVLNRVADSRERSGHV